MPNPHLLQFESRSDTLCVQLRNNYPSEEDLQTIYDEILDAQAEHGSAKVVLSLGGENPVLLFSVFLAKLVVLQKRLNERSCQFLLSGVTPTVMSIFTVSALGDHFTFVEDYDAAEAFSAES